jgi:hypothetical protein
MARVKRIPDLEADPIQEAASRLMDDEQLVDPARPTPR